MLYSKRRKNLGGGRRKRSNRKSSSRFHYSNYYGGSISPPPPPPKSVRSVILNGPDLVLYEEYKIYKDLFHSWRVNHMSEVQAKAKADAEAMVSMTQSDKANYIINKLKTDNDYKTKFISLLWKINTLYEMKDEVDRNNDNEDMGTSQRIINRLRFKFKEIRDANIDIYNDIATIYTESIYNAEFSILRSEANKHKDDVFIKEIKEFNEFKLRADGADIPSWRN